MPVNDIRKVKDRIRRRSRDFREGLTREAKAELDRAILDRITSMRIYTDNNLILTYVSTPIEVDTRGLIKRALADNKTVAVPRCIKGSRDMEFYIIKSLDDLEKGTFGVLEPKADVCQKLTDTSHSVCIVPGLSFDCSGYRVGYGKGYYDRFLSGYRGYTVGICYKPCVEWRFPHGFFDKPVDLLITERYIRKTTKNSRKE